MRAYKFRLYPSKAQEKTLNFHLWVSKDLWNSLLETNKKKYNEEGRFLSKVEMQKMVKNSGLHSQVAQTLSHRLYNALWRMVKLKKQGKECGFPRFKSPDRMKSLYYPQSGFSLGKRLRVTPFGGLSIKQHREIKGKIKTLTLKRESSGKWFAIFCVREDKEQQKKNCGEKIGIDLGLTNFAALSDGKIIKNPRHFRKHEERLASSQRRLSRCEKGSRNRKKAKLKVARVHEKIANCRSDFLHKLSSELVNAYSLIALENLRSKEMAEGNFGKSIHDAGWRKFADMLAYKAEGAGCKVEFVSPEGTTKECSSCGAVVEKALSERMHTCPFCGLFVDRDINAARNILKRATAGTAESNASGDETRVSSVKEDTARLVWW
ncbi:MAG: RNA-guided endonuclease TnpB family protein [Candidatus Micrarchaeota archaeon]|nr:RNA-guided endonuclease TnpB family protein [Candidatus Micrarchaeota archaeon]